MSAEKWFEGVESGEEFLEKMFALTKADGVVYIPNWYADRDIDAPDYPDLRCELSWNENDCRTVTERFTRLKQDLLAIAERDRKYDAEREDEDEFASEQEDEDDLPPRQEEVSDTYLTAWKTDVYNPLEIDDIQLRSFYHEDVTDDEQELFERYQSELNDDAERRIGEGMCAFQAVNEAKRLYRLYKVDAPPVILCREECLLAAAMAMHAFGKRVVALSPRKLP